MLDEAFNDDVLSQTQTYDWFKCFKNSRISVDDDKSLGHYAIKCHCSMKCDSGRTGRPSKNSVTLWNHHMVHANGFCPKNWIWVALWQVSATIVMNRKPNLQGT